MVAYDTATILAYRSRTGKRRVISLKPNSRPPRGCPPADPAPLCRIAQRHQGTWRPLIAAACPACGHVAAIGRAGMTLAVRSAGAAPAIGVMGPTPHRGPCLGPHRLGVWTFPAVSACYGGVMQSSAPSGREVDTHQRGFGHETHVNALAQPGRASGNRISALRRCGLGADGCALARHRLSPAPGARTLPKEPAMGLQSRLFPGDATLDAAPLS